MFRILFLIIISENEFNPDPFGMLKILGEILNTKNHLGSFGKMLPKLLRDPSLITSFSTIICRLNDQKKQYSYIENIVSPDTSKFKNKSKKQLDALADNLVAILGSFINFLIDFQRQSHPLTKTEVHLGRNDYLSTIAKKSRQPHFLTKTVVHLDRNNLSTIA